MRFGSYRVFTFPVGPTTQVTMAASRQQGVVCLKSQSYWRVQINFSTVKTLNKIADVVVWNFAVDFKGGTNDARSIYRRTSEFYRSRRRPALQRPHPRRNSLVNHHARLLDWFGRHAWLDLPHYCRLHRILLRQRSSGPPPRVLELKAASLNKATRRSGHDFCVLTSVMSALYSKSNQKAIGLECWWCFRQRVACLGFQVCQRCHNA